MLSLLVALGALASSTPAGTARLVGMTLFRWIAAGDLAVDFALRLDPLSAVMLFFVTVVGFLIHVYSVGYMHDEPASAFARFFAYLNLFMFAMLILVLGATCRSCSSAGKASASARTC